MIKLLSIACIVSVVILLLVSPAMSVEEQVIAGAGPSTKIVELFVKEFSKQQIAMNYSFKIPPKSTKHAGGIKNTEFYLFGRTGRPLNDKEKALDIEEISLARLPISFVIGKNAGISKLTIRQVEDIFTGRLSNWKEVGGTNEKIYTIGREPTEALFSILKKNNPAFERAKFDRILKRDHFVVKFFLLPKGDYAIAFGAKPNFDAKGIKLLEVEGFSLGVSVGLVYASKNENHELISAVRKFARSGDWAKAVGRLGLLPPE
jgi:hypothetical protein